MSQISAKIALVTGNQKKFDYITGNIVLPADVTLVMTPVETHEIQASTLAGVCRHKALEAWGQLKQPLLAHDSGMLIDELNGYPGPYTKDMIKTIGVTKFFEIVQGFQKPTFVYQDCLTYIDEKGELYQFISDTGPVYRFATRQDETIHPDMPLNSMVAFSTHPDITLSEMDDYIDVYKKMIAQLGIATCWQDFSDFLFEHYASAKDAA